MTKSQVKELKEWFAENGEPDRTFYKSKEETFIITVYTYGDCGTQYNKDLETECIAYALNLISKKMRPRYEIKRVTYQGFLHNTTIRLH